MLGAALQRIDQESLVPPHLNVRLPDFEVMTSKGQRRLADYRGKWLLLFSQPDQQDPASGRIVSDFSAVYTGFQAANCELLLLLRSPRPLRPGPAAVVRHLPAADTPFAIVSGLAAQLVDGLRMLPADAETSRLRVADIIDPEGILRSRTYYPAGARCSANRLLYQVRGLQAMDEMAGSRNDQASPWYF